MGGACVAVEESAMQNFEHPSSRALPSVAPLSPAVVVPPLPAAAPLFPRAWHCACAVTLRSEANDERTHSLSARVLQPPPSSSPPCMLLRRLMMRAAHSHPQRSAAAAAAVTAAAAQCASRPRAIMPSAATARAMMRATLHATTVASRSTLHRALHAQAVSAAPVIWPASDSSAATAAAPAADEYAQLEAQFLRHVPVVDGMDAMEQLQQMAAAASSSASIPGPSPSSSALPRLIVIGGDQCTGKSTLSARLASLISGRAFSAGTIFRARAKRMGLSSAELSRRALADPSIDVGIEFDLCRLLLSRGMGPEGALVIEGRQPAVMAGFLRHKFGSAAAPDFTVRLVCSTREQALRFIQREAGDKLFHMAAKVLPEPLDSLSAASPLLRALGMSLREDDAVSTKLRKDSDRLCVMFEDNDRRDEDDRRRFLTLYGKGLWLDYRNPRLYDAVIDTTPNEAPQTFAQTVQAMETHVAKQREAAIEDAAAAKGIRSKL